MILFFNLFNCDFKLQNNLLIPEEAGYLAIEHHQHTDWCDEFEADIEEAAAPGLVPGFHALVHNKICLPLPADEQ